MTTRTTTDGAVEREHAMQRVLKAWIITGLLFMLLPGTFLGVWNLMGISSGETMMAIPPAWLQAHGHAQVFGWVGSFILGIGYYSLNKMAGKAPARAHAAWLSWALWTFGAGLRWWANITLHAWRIALPLSGLAELTAFVIFFRTVSRHKPAGAAGEAQRRPAWMKLVLLATLGFAAALLDNLGLVIRTALVSSTPAVAAPADQLFLTLVLWSFLVPLIWGFNARWLPIFLGLPEPSARGLLGAWLMALGAVLAAVLAGAWLFSGILAMAASVTAALALHIPRRSERPPKTAGVHPSFPFFARLPYAWLLAASALSILAPLADRAGGIWGASRHALTVGFVASMVLVIGQRVLPAFCGMRMLFSQRLMFWSLALLNLGCLLRVGSEPLAYEGIWHAGWSVLPVSGMVELSGIVLYAANMFLTLARPPEMERGEAIRGPLRRHRLGANARVCPYTVRFAPNLFLALAPFSPLPSVASRQGSAVPNYAHLALRSRTRRNSIVGCDSGPAATRALALHKAGGFALIMRHDTFPGRGAADSGCDAALCRARPIRAERAGGALPPPKLRPRRDSLS